MGEQIERMRLRGETANAKRAFLDYMGLGPKRSLRKLHEIYRSPPYTDNDGDNPPPSRQLKTIQAWSSAFNWVKRVKQVSDEQLDVILQEQRRALAKVSSEKYALPHERIKLLNQITELLADYLIEAGLQTTIVKQVGSGKNTKMVTEDKVDVAAIQALRGLLDDLARETGGRPKNVKHEVDGEVTSKHVFVLPPVEPLQIPDSAPVIEMEETSVGEFKQVGSSSDNGHEE